MFLKINLLQLPIENFNLLCFFPENVQLLFQLDHGRVNTQISEELRTPCSSCVKVKLQYLTERDIPVQGGAVEWGPVRFIV